MDAQFVNSLGWLLTYGLIYFGVAAAVLLLIRQAVLWYFRINQMADDLHTIAQHYRAQAQASVQERRAANPLITHPFG